MSAFVPRSRVRVVGLPQAVAPRSDDIRERGIESRRRFVDPMPHHEGTFLQRPTPVVGLRTDTAFLIQFRTNADPATDKLTGRIEHVASGRTETFESLKDLPTLLQRMLKGIEK